MAKNDQLLDRQLLNEEHRPPPLVNDQALNVPNPSSTVVSPLAQILADPMHPFFLHPGESLGLVLVSTPLTESNYHFWCQAMIMALESKNKVGFVDGTIPKPAMGYVLRAIWERNNTIVRSWIIRSLSTEIAQSVLLVKNARALWLELKQRFCQGNHLRLADLQEELY